MKVKAFLLSVIYVILSFSVSAEVVNLNKADAASLAHHLKGVGEKKAESIIEYRTEHEKFNAIEEIMEVKGIGEGIFNKIKDNLSLTEGVETMQSSSKKAEESSSKEDKKEDKKDKADK
jgi:competence protein ComEA